MGSRSGMDIWVGEGVGGGVLTGGGWDEEWGRS